MGRLKVMKLLVTHTLNSVMALQSFHPVPVQMAPSRRLFKASEFEVLVNPYRSPTPRESKI